MSRAGWLLVAVSGLVAVAVGYALHEAGSPGEARLEQLDARRVEDLRVLAQALEARGTRVRAVDDSLFRAVVAQGPGQAHDPVTGEAYRFRALSARRYALGARFDRATDARDLDEYQRGWAHGKGDWWYVFGRGGGFLPDTAYAGR